MVSREAIIMVEVKDCPGCGANSFNEVFKAPYFRGDGELFSIKECDACKFWLTSPRPADDELGSYYETGEYISHNDKKEGLVDQLYHAVRNISLKRKLALITKASGSIGALLDFGAGTGHFANVANIAGWKVTGVEPSAEARKVAKETNGLDLIGPEDMEWDAALYNVITLWHVLEHLPDLNGHLHKFENSLKPGGALIVAVPNHESLDSNIYKESWAALDVPLHLYHFKKQNIEQLGKKHGFILEVVKNMPFDSFYVSLLSEKVKNGKQNYVKAFINGIKSNLRGRSDKNQSSLIYILRKPI